MNRIPLQRSTPICFQKAHRALARARHISSHRRKIKDTPPSLDSQDADPWTYFCLFSRSEADGAACLLRENCLVFEIKEEEEQADYPAGGWSGPFAIWVRDEHVALAADLLGPHFTKQS